MFNKPTKRIISVKMLRGILMVVWCLCFSRSCAIFSLRASL